MKKKGCRVAAICDADIAVPESMKIKLEGNTVEYYRDYRKLLMNENIDAVLIAGPNHTLSLRSPPSKPASTSLWKNPFPITCGKAAS